MVDDELVARAKSDRAAFGALYDRYYPLVFRYCVRRLFNRETADDVVSEVFLSVAAKMRDFPGNTETDFRRWLFRIATNAVNAYVRQSQRRRALFEAAAQSRLKQRGGSWEGAVPGGELLDWPVVYGAVLELDEHDQSILMLRFFASLTHEEIADVVESTAGAVRTALSRILANLRIRFNPTSPTNLALPTPGKE